MRLPTWIADRVLRRRARLHQTPLDRFRVRIARTVDDYEDAFKLVHVAYVYQGIKPVRSSELRITPQHVLPESTVFVAYEGDLIVGTMTVTRDSPASLPLAHDYPEPIDRLRAIGTNTVVEYGSLAVVRRCWRSGVSHLLSMACTWFAINVLGGTHCAIGVHPKAEPYYRALYDFHPLGEPQGHADLAAPVLGMVQDIGTFPAFLRRRFSQPMASGLGVADHFTDTLPPCIEIPSNATLESLARWKLPRTVFREMFIARTDTVAQLDPKTRRQLEGWRTIRTTRPTSRSPARLTG